MSTYQLLMDSCEYFEGIQQLIGMYIKTYPTAIESLLNFIMPFGNRSNENQRIVSLSIMTMLVSSEMIDNELRSSVLDKHILPRLNDQNVIVKRLVIRGIRFTVDKYRELQHDKIINDQITVKAKEKNGNIKN